MTVVFGDKRRFAAQVGDGVGPAVRQVDLWAADQWLTCGDNLAFVSQFRIAVADSADRLRSGHSAAPPFAGLSAVAAHRRLVEGSGDEEHDDLRREPFRFSTDEVRRPTTSRPAFLFRDGDSLTLA